MILRKSPVHLLDANVALALLHQNHIHNRAAEKWFDTPGLQWAMCAFTEAAVLRFLTRPATGELNMAHAAAALEALKRQPGYRFQAISSDWRTLTQPFSQRIQGHNQVTDAFLLGLAVRENLVLTTFDKAMLHLAGEHRNFVRVLEAT
jgi:toxin-antitoxin system PIN domain toxin